MTEWQCACESDPAFDQSVNPPWVRACGRCGRERPESERYALLPIYAERDAFRRVLSQALQWAELYAVPPGAMWLDEPAWFEAARRLLEGER